MTENRDGKHTLFLLGAPRLEENGRIVPITRRKVLALLAYLAVTQQPHRRETLTTLLWPDAPRQHAFAYLRRTLALAKKAAGEDVLAVSRDLVRWQMEAPFCVDVVEFNRCLKAVQTHHHPSGELCPGCLAQLTRAANLYHGVFLAGFSLPDAPAFEEWQLRQAEARQRELAALLKQLATHYAAQTEMETAVTYARRWVELDPLHEPAQQQLIRLYAAAGQPTAAPEIN